MREGFDEQLRKWTARLPFSSLRTRLLLLLFLALLPAYGFILYSTIEARQQAAEDARKDARWLTRLLAEMSAGVILFRYLVTERRKKDETFQ